MGSQIPLLVALFQALLLTTTLNLSFFQIDKSLLHLLRMWTQLNRVTSIHQNLTNNRILLLRRLKFINSLLKIFFFNYGYDAGDIGFNLTLVEIILVGVWIIDIFQIFTQGRALMSHGFAGHHIRRFREISLNRVNCFFLRDFRSLTRINKDCISGLWAELRDLIVPMNCTGLCLRYLVQVRYLLNLSIYSVGIRLRRNLFHLKLVLILFELVVVLDFQWFVNGDWCENVLGVQRLIILSLILRLSIFYEKMSG